MPTEQAVFWNSPGMDLSQQCFKPLAAWSWALFAHRYPSYNSDYQLQKHNPYLHGDLNVVVGGVCYMWPMYLEFKECACRLDTQQEAHCTGKQSP